MFTGLFSWESASHLSPMLLFSVVMFMVKPVLNTWSIGEGGRKLSLRHSPHLFFFFFFFFFSNDKLLKFFLLQCFPIWYKCRLPVYLAFLHACFAEVPEYFTVMYVFGLPAPQDVEEVPSFYKAFECGTADFPGWHLPLDIIPSGWPYMIPRKVRGT